MFFFGIFISDLFTCRYCKYSRLPFFSTGYTAITVPFQLFDISKHGAVCFVIIATKQRICRFIGFLGIRHNQSQLIAFLIVFVYRPDVYLSTVIVKRIGIGFNIFSVSVKIKFHSMLIFVICKSRNFFFHFFADISHVF